MRTLTILASFSALIYLLSGCAKEGFDINLYSDEDYAEISQYLNISQSLENYDMVFPTYYRRANSQTDDRIATVGRVLFYDANLSKDRSVSCASCHEQNIAFSDDKAFSDGIEGKQTTRNSIALGSVFSFREYYGVGRIPFFWDNRANTVEDQSTETFANKREMGMEMHQVVDRVWEQPYYRPLFRAAYEQEDITEAMVLEAISVFVNSIGSFDSKFDQQLEVVTDNPNVVMESAHKEFPGFSEAENRGKAIYMANCASCHATDMGAPPVTSGNNGLYENYEDIGIGEHQYGSSNDGLFKVPTLRNIALTAPYMHDGSIATLPEVIEHYNSGIKPYVNLSNSLKDGAGNAKRFYFSQQDKDDLLAFLYTLTDESLLVDERFSDPFIR